MYTNTYIPKLRNAYITIAFDASCIFCFNMVSIRKYFNWEILEMLSDKCGQEDFIYNLMNGWLWNYNLYFED